MPVKACLWVGRSLCIEELQHPCISLLFSFSMWLGWVVSRPAILGHDYLLFSGMPNGTSCNFSFLYLETCQKVIKHQNMKIQTLKSCFTWALSEFCAGGSIKPGPRNHYSDSRMIICICFLHFSPKSHTGWRIMEKKKKGLYTYKYVVGIYQILSQRILRFL